MKPALPKTRIILAILLLLLLYIPFHNSYRTDYIDDAWSYSWARNFWVDGEVFDTVFGYLDGDGGTALFGRSYAFVYGAWGMLTGWSRPAGYLLSVFFLLAAALLWRKNLKLLEYPPSLSWAFVFMILIMESYFSIGHRLRGDAMVFFLATLALTLFLIKKPFFSALALCFAVEVHPYGMVGLFYILSVLVSGWLSPAQSREQTYLSKRTILLFVAGGLVGIGYYLLLHFKWLGGVADLSGRTGGNPFSGYFFNHRYSWRHWPELAVIAAAIVVFVVRREYRNDRYIPVFAAMMLVFSLLLPRGNSHYVVFLYPPFVLLILYLALQLKIMPFLLAAFLLFQLPQYGWLFWNQRDFSWQKYLNNLNAAVTVDESTDKEIFIYGPSSAWFALMDQDFHAYGYFGRAGIRRDGLPESFIVIENGNFEKEGARADLAPYYDNYVKRELSTWEEPGHSRYTVSRWEKKQ